MKKKLLITGGSGFIGHNIIDELIKSRPDIEIYNLDKRAYDRKDIIHIPCEALTFDYKEIGHTFDYIINLLALANDRQCGDLAYAEKVNVDFTRKTAEFALSQPHLKKFIHLSSIVLYSNDNIPPVREDGKLFIYYTNYSFTKGLAEAHLEYFQQKKNSQDQNAFWLRNPIQNSD